MKLYYYMLTALLVVVAQADCLQAQIPRTLSYQGVLTDAAGKPRSEGNYTFIFRLYDVASGGTAIWSESKTLFVKGGLFSTTLGDQTPFGANVKFDRPYWLGIQVNNEPELAPHIALTSVGYSMSSLRADTASFSVASLADTTWKHSGANIYRLNGNIGIGTISPSVPLDIFGHALIFQGSVEGNNSEFPALKIRQHSDLTYPNQVAFEVEAGVTDVSPKYFRIYTGKNDPWNLRMRFDGSMDINGSTAIYGPAFISQGSLEGNNSKLPAMKIRQHSDLAYPNQIAFEVEAGVTDVSPKYFRIYTAKNDPWNLRMSFDGSMEINGPTEIKGRTKTCVLEITGGCDLAEPFPTSEAESLPLGAIVVIDEDTPGHLKLSRKAYDKGVAGVVSGAGGINPGLTLRQEGVMEGEQNIALSGRVYALATAANGPIKPGDLLTTSNLPGHAMKATDHDLANGAVIGKAMSRLEQEEGLVLVLVNLQ